MEANCRYINGHIQYEMICEQCHRKFFAARQHAKFCSQNCRKQASRRKDHMRRAADKAIAQILEIQRYMDTYEDLNIVGGLEIERILARLKM